MAEASSDVAAAPAARRATGGGLWAGDEAGPGDIRIGVDLGGTKIEAIALGPAGEVIARRRVPTPKDGYEPILDAVATLVSDLTAAAGARDPRVGLGAPGRVSPATGLSGNGNTTVLNGRPFATDLAARLGAPLRMANDANCLAMSEAADGAGAGAETVFAAILGTGVGGGLVHQGRLIAGANGIGGEWGHVPMPHGDGGAPAPRRCWCGRGDCVETWLSGPALAADHLAATGASLTAEAIAAAADAGAPDAEATLARYAARLGRALAVVVNVFDPDVVVLGGGVSNIARLYPAAMAALRRHAFSDHLATRIVRNRHGDSSGVRGAAWLWPAT